MLGKIIRSFTTRLHNTTEYISEYNQHVTSYIPLASHSIRIICEQCDTIWSVYGNQNVVETEVQSHLRAYDHGGRHVTRFGYTWRILGSYEESSLRHQNRNYTPTKYHDIR